jgi:hypothetical protein
MVEFNLFSLFSLSFHLHVHFPKKAEKRRLSSAASSLKSSQQSNDGLLSSQVFELPIQINVVPYLEMPDGSLVKLKRSPPVIDYSDRLSRRD